MFVLCQCELPTLTDQTPQKQTLPPGRSCRFQPFHGSWRSSEISEAVETTFLPKDSGFLDLPRLHLTGQDLLKTIQWFWSRVPGATQQRSHGMSWEVWFRNACIPLFHCVSSVFHVSKGSPAATSPVAPSRAAEALTGVTWATCHKGLFMTCYGFVVQATKKQMTRFEPNFAAVADLESR